MRTMHVAGLALVVAMGTGCGGSSAYAPSPVVASGYGGGGGAAAPEAVAASAPPAAKSEASPVMPAPAPPPPLGDSWGGAASTASRAPVLVPAPTERPGLGTEWGETRHSEVHDVDFERSDPSRPFAVATLHYNDRRGVEALAAYHSFHGPRMREQTAAGGAVTVSVRDEYNEPLEALQLADRTFVIGEQGQRYSIVIENRSGHRIEAVTSVDGVDVMSGHTGSVDNRGYVLDAYQSMVVDGFRQSHSQVAAFRFAKVADSYAAQTGSARNVGVIGIAFFDERGDAFVRWTPNELHLRDTANPFPGGNDRRFAQPPPSRW
jgi:hypothetical protein